MQRFFCTRFRTTVDYDRKYLWSNSQAENGIMNYDFHVRWKQFGKLWSTYEKNYIDLWPWNSIGLEVVVVHVHAKFHQAECSGSWVIVSTSFCALSYNCEKSENPVPWPWPLILKFSNLSVYCGCQGTRSSSSVQQLMSYCAYREKTSDENNTVRRYHTDITKTGLNRTEMREIEQILWCKNIQI